MLHIGFHASTDKGLEGLGTKTLYVGGDTFAFFTRNPRGGSSSPVDPEDAEKLNKIRQDNHFVNPVAHAPYTMNPCSANPDLRVLAKNMMIEDFKKLEYIPDSYYNFHPGSHTGQGEDTGIEHTATMIAEVFKAVTLDCKTTLLVETMAGKGSEIGKTFEEVQRIIQKAEEKFGQSLKGKLGVCIDTCHLWDGGYDIVNNLDGVLTDFDKIIGFDRLYAVHLNDSKNDLNTHKDRHETIGNGKIGLEALKRVTRHPVLCNLPFILETPNEIEGYKKEIELLRQ